MVDNTNETPKPGTPEYEDHMADKGAAAVDGAPKDQPAGEDNTPTDAPAKPDSVPEKFWNAEKGEVDFEAWGQSTQELERKLSGQSQDDDDKKAGKDDKGTDEGDDKTPDELPEGSTLKPDDFNKYSQEFAENGELSDDTYGALEKAGIPRDYVDSYIAGQKAQQSMQEAQVLERSGLKTRDNFDRAIEWAKANMPEADLEAYNTEVSSKDAARVTAAVKSLGESFRNAKGSTESTLLNGDGGSPSADVFESSAQVVKAMSDPRYKSDPAYRKEVGTKLERSPNAFR